MEKEMSEFLFEGEVHIEGYVPPTENSLSEKWLMLRY